MNETQGLPSRTGYVTPRSSGGMLGPPTQDPH